MATLALAAAGIATSGSVGASLLGIGAGILDTILVNSFLIPAQKQTDPGLDSLRVTSAAEGGVIPRVFGRMRVSGNIIAAEDFTETSTVTRTGGKFRPRVETEKKRYTATFAVALCEGVISGIGRIWADGEEIDLTDVVMRWYPGSETQAVDAWVAATYDDAPAYRGTAYVVFEDLDLEPFGRRLPQLSFEVFRPLDDADVAEGLVKAVTMIPASGEFVYGTTAVTREGADESATQPENTNARADRTDFMVALDQLQAQAPAVTQVTLVVAWFGTDLRCGDCLIKPGVEKTDKTTSVAWEVNGVTRATAYLISRDEGGIEPAFGGTPSDATVIEAITEMKARGLAVTFYPFILMDVAPGNALPNPYSDNAATTGQPAYPWRGRITCSPAAGFVGTVDKTATAATQVDAFFGAATAADFTIDDTSVSWAGGEDWGFDRFILHYAHLCAVAGGVDAFLIGSELRGLTQVRSTGTSTPTYPAVDRLLALIAEVRKILVAITSDLEVTPMEAVSPPGNTPAGVYLVNGDDGATWQSSGKVLIGDAFDFVSTEPGFSPRGVQDFSIADLGLTEAQVDAGDVIVVFGARTRHSGVGGTFTDFTLQWITKDGSGAADGGGRIGAKHRLHALDSGLDTEFLDTYTIPAGTRYLRLNYEVSWYTSVQVTAFYAVAGIRPANALSYAADWSEYFGHQPADGSGDVFFHLDPLWASQHVDFVGIDNYMPLSDWRDGFEHLDAVAADGWLGASDIGYLQSNIEGGEGFDWYYASEADRATQTRTVISDGAHSKPWVFRYKDLAGWWGNQHFNRPGGIEAAGPTAWVPESKPFRFTEYGCPAIDRGANQPNVFVDPQSSESRVPHHSRGTRDDAVQRSYLEATCRYWGDPANNPASTVTGRPMVDIDASAAWAWDARPYPWFPGLGDRWADGDNWQQGHWLNGRLGACSVKALVRRLCTDGGMDAADLDVGELVDHIEGYAIRAIEPPRNSLAALMRHFAFDATETEGTIAFRRRGRPRVAGVALPDMVAGKNGASPVELVRTAQETELPRVIRWTLARSDEDYDPAVVESPEAETDSEVVIAESFPFAASPEISLGRVHRALRETWTERETAAFRLPPSWLRLDPADVLGLTHDGRTVDYRVERIAHARDLALELRRADREAYDTPAGEPSPVTLGTPAIYGGPLALILDLPQWQDGVEAHWPYLAVTSDPWPAAQALWKSVAGGDYELAVLAETRAIIGTLAADMPAGPTDVFDMGNVLDITLPRDTLSSVTDLQMLAGANRFAVQTATGWEIVSGATATLVGPGRYTLARLLRGQRGTEWAMGATAGARVVMLTDALVPIPVGISDIGRDHAWKIGPSNLAVDDPSLVALSTDPAGAGLETFSPTHLVQPQGPWSPGDITLDWTRRDRALAADSWDGSTIPLSDTPEGYEVDVMDGSTVKRTIASSTTTATYTAAQQTADWGAPLAAGPLALNIYQTSPYVGRGAAFAASLEF